MGVFIFDVGNEQENFRNLFRQTPELFCMLKGPDHIFEFVNEAHRRTLGFDATGMSVLEAHPESVELHGILNDVYITGKTAQLFEIPVNLAHRIRYFNLTYSARRDANAKINGVLILGTEVSNDVMIRNSLVSQKEALELTLSESSVEQILHGHAKMLELQLGDDVMAAAMLVSGDGQRLKFETAPSLPKEYSQAIDQMKIGPQACSCGTAAHRKMPVVVSNIATDPLWDEHRSLALSFGLHACWSTPIFSSDKNVLGTFAIYCRSPRNPTVREHQLVDLVTRTAAVAIERKKSISDLQKAKAEAEIANESKSRFLANMSHEIRTPLAAILGFSELLKGRTKETDPQAEIHLHRVLQNAKQLSRLLDDLLDLSKIEADLFEMDREEFDLLAALDDVLSSVDLMAREKGLTICQSLIGKIPRVVYSDPMRFRQILINLVGNAVKFTEKGRIEIQMEIKEQGAKTQLFVRVKDTGIGLSTERQNKIFARFVQGDTSVSRKYGGSGLGLVLSRRMARLLGGELVLEESVEGKGSTFGLTIEVRIPAQSEGPGLSADSDKNLLSQNKLLQGLLVLVVDDSVDNQIISKMFIESAGAQVELADNGLDAVQKLSQKTYDVVLMDIQMPTMDGYQALKVARAKGYKCPILALTAHALKDEKESCLAAGFSGYISKPISRKALIRRLSIFKKPA